MKGVALCSKATILLILYPVLGCFEGECRTRSRIARRPHPGQLGCCPACSADVHRSRSWRFAPHGGHGKPRLPSTPSPGPARIPGRHRLGDWGSPSRNSLENQGKSSTDVYFNEKLGVPCKVELLQGRSSSRNVSNLGTQRNLRYIDGKSANPPISA
jgi:hypothetical protein